MSLWHLLLLWHCWLLALLFRCWAPNHATCLSEHAVLSCHYVLHLLLAVVMAGVARSASDKEVPTALMVLAHLAMSQPQLQELPTNALKVSTPIHCHVCARCQLVDGSVHHHKGKLWLTVAHSVLPSCSMQSTYTAQVVSYRITQPAIGAHAEGY